MKIVNLTVIILNSVSAMKWTANKEEANKFLQTRLFVFLSQSHSKNRSEHWYNNIFVKNNLVEI